MPPRASIRSTIDTLPYLYSGADARARPTFFILAGFCILTQDQNCMSDLFEPTSAAQILDRLSRLHAAQPALWGKMNAAQMLTHCQAPFSVYFGEIKLRQSLIGLLFGRIAKRKLFADKPWPRGLPTAREFVVMDKREFEEERRKLAAQIGRFSCSSIQLQAPKHPFFGKMSAQEWSRFAYRHLDHHLQQFGV